MYVYDLFVKHLEQDQRVYGMITQKSIGYELEKRLKSLVINGKPVRVMWYHGDNLSYDENLVSHKDKKLEDFKNVNESWA